MEYLTILLGLLIIALILEKTQHIHLYKNRKERIEITLLFFIAGVIWDTFAIWRGHWIYPPASITGIYIGLMPIEDYLYILVIPYFIITVYKFIDSKFRIKRVK